MLIYNSTVVTSGTNIDLDQAAMTAVYIGKLGFIGSQLNAAVTGYSDNLGVYVAGDVVGSTFGINLGNDDSNATSEHVKLYKTGSVFSTGEAVTFNAVGSTLDNAGVIETTYLSAVVVHSGNFGSLSQINNSGTITAGTVGAGVYVSGAEDAKVVNTGRISGGNSAINSVNSIADMTVINKGTLVNGIYFGAGDDIYDGRGGKIVGGALHGGRGNDKFTCGAGSETFVFATDDQKDTIIGFGAKGKSHDILDFSDWAANDTFAEVKSHASQHGDDLWITGNGGDKIILDHHHFSDLAKSDFLF